MTEGCRNTPMSSDQETKDNTHHARHWYLSLDSVGNSGEGKENRSLEPDYKSNTPLGIETPSNLKSLPVKKKFNQFKIEFFPFLWSFIFLMAFMSFMESSSWP